MNDRLIQIEPCTSKCKGQSCCNCCGKAPAMHKYVTSGIPLCQYSRDCCSKTRWEIPEQCMHLCGKTREQWMKETNNE